MRLLGVGQSHVGERDGALATFDEALAAVGAERAHRPEILVSRAQCFARFAADPATVEAAFRAAEDANAIEAFSWALRAATGLARVLAATGRRDEARAVLTPIYARFTEGFGDTDLVEAKALLQELA
jgi:predicted ATPase